MSLRQICQGFPTSTLLLYILIYTAPLPAQTSTPLPTLDCESATTPYRLDSLGVVADCSFDSAVQWILAWGKGGNYIIVKRADSVFMRRSHEVMEEGHIMQSNFYQSHRKKVYFIFSVFGMEDGDIAIKLFTLSNQSLDFHGNIPVLALTDDGAYNDAPIHAMTIYENKEGHLEIFFMPNKYQIEEDNTFFKVDGALQYRFDGEKIIRIP